MTAIPDNSHFQPTLEGGHFGPHQAHRDEGSLALPDAYRALDGARARAAHGELFR